MTRTGHYLLGAAAGLGLAMGAGWPAAVRAALHGWPGWVETALTVGAGITAAAVAAIVAPLPDCDQRRWWTHRHQREGWRKRRDLPKIRRDLPRWLQHRRITHFWGLAVPVVAPAPFAPWPIGWILAAVAVGWLSHLLGDWVFGKRQPREAGGRPAGIPIGWALNRRQAAPGERQRTWRWIYHGVGLRCGGRLEKFVAWPVLAAGLVLQTAILIGAR